jgi:hypothetical protein
MEISMDHKERVKQLGVAFKAEARAIELVNANKCKIRRDEVEYVFTDASVATMGYATVQRNYPKSEFGVYSLVSVTGGLIYQVMQETRLDKSESFCGDGIFAGTSHNLIDEGHYPVTSNVSVESVARQIVDGMREAYVPIIQCLTGNYGEGLDFLLRVKGRYIRNPFTTGVILLGLSGSFERLSDLVAAAMKNKSFHDFHSKKDNQRKIVAPIRQWFEKH